MKNILLASLVALTFIGCNASSPTPKEANTLSHNQALLNGEGPKDAINLAVVYTFDENNDEAVNKLAKTDLETIGIYQNDAHHRVNDVYEKKFGTTYLENITFSPVFNEDVIRPLLNKDPRLSGFAPFNLLNYRLKSDKKSVVMHLTPEAMLNILDIKDKEISDTLIKSFEPMDKMITEKLGGKKSYIKMQGRAQNTMMNFEIPFEEQEDIEEYLEDFQEAYELAFVQNGFVVAGFYNIKESYNSDEDVMPGYDSFWAYSLCHIPFSYKIFDGEDALPVAGIFGPCSMYIYKKVGENKLVIGMPTLEAWVAALNIQNPEKLAKIKQLDEQIRDIMMGLGAEPTPNVNPLTK